MDVVTKDFGMAKYFGVRVASIVGDGVVKNVRE